MCDFRAHCFSPIKTLELELIANSELGHQMTWIGGVRLQLLSQMSHV